MLSLGLTTPEAQMNYILKKAMAGDSAKAGDEAKAGDAGKASGSARN
jgi:hypothetical protein